MPSVESASISAVIAASQKTMANIGKIDFERLAGKVDNFLDSANSLLGDKRVGKTLDRAVEIADNVKELSDTLKAELNRENIKKLSDQVQTTFNNLNSTLTQLRDSANGANIPETSAKARDLMESADRLVKKAESLRGELSESVAKLNATLDSARLLFDLLEKDPDSVIRGKVARPIVEPEKPLEK